MPVGAGFIPARIGENKKMTEHKKLQPEIRFAGFTDDWEQRKLGEFGISTSGTSLENEFLDSGKYKVISIGSYSENSIYTDQGIRVNKTNKTESKILRKNDLTMILNDKTASGNIIGRVLLIDADESYVYNQRTQRIETDQSKFVPEFLYQLLNANNIRKKIILAAQGNTQIYVNWSSIRNISYLVPKSKEEQTQIGNFFKQLDDTIALHQRTLEKYQKLKVSYLEKMFPKENEQYPELRFPNFTDAWEQCKAEDVFISISEKNHETFPVLSATQDKGMISRNEVGIDIKYDVNSLKTYKLVRKDQFVIHLRSFQGGFAHSAIDGITSPAYTILDFKDKRIHSPLFWREIFKSDFFIKRLESVIYGIRDGRSISYDEFLKLNFNYPSFEEQTQIGNFFKQLDDTIALHQREVEKYKKIKQSYLEKMFI